MNKTTIYTPDIALPYIRGSIDHAEHDLGRKFLSAYFASVAFDAKIIDVGCGNGIDIKHYETMGFANVTGIEPSQSLRDGGKRLFGNLDIREGRFESLPFPDHSADVIVSRFAMHYCSSVADALDESARVLKPGGKLVAIVSHPDADREELANDDGTITVTLFNKAVAVTFPRHSREDYVGETFKRNFRLEKVHEYCGLEQDRGTNGRPNALCFSGTRNVPEVPLTLDNG